MKRINTPTASSGMFVDGNPLTGTKGTQFNAEWPNQVEEEICKLIEAAGQTVGGSDHQLKDIFTALYVLEAKFKSLELLKAFTGGNSTVVLDGEKIALSATGTAVTDNSKLEISRQEIKFTRSVNGVALVVSITPGAIEVSSTEGLNDPVVTRVTNDKVMTPVLEAGSATIGGMRANNRSSFERINMGSSKSFFHYPDNSSVNINTLLENSSIEVAAGDVITIKCDLVNGTGLQVSFAVSGFMTGHVLISSCCAMQFICTSIVSSESYWAPLCNTSVSVS